MSSEMQKERKRGRTQYLSNAKRHRGGRQLEVGMQGILITCNMNEGKCVGEAYSLLGEYGDLLYGAEKLGEKDDRASGNEEEEVEDDDDDVEAALKKEVDQIRTSTKKNLHRFRSVESGAKNVVFIRTLNVEPEKLVHHILKDLYTTKKNKSRVILRMLPVTGTCKAFPEDVKKYSETFFQPWFKAPNKGTFQILYKARNNSHMNRDEVIKDLADVALSAPSQTVKEEFSIAAGQLRKEKSEVKFGQVDITQEKNLGKEFKIQDFPTFKLFIEGDRKQPIDCKGVRTAAAFVTWINRRIGHSFVLLNTTEQYESFIQSDTVSVVGFFKDLNSNLIQHFTEAAKDVSEFPFGFVGNEDILSYVGITGNMVAIHKKEKPVRYLLSEEEIKSKLDLIRSIRIYIMDVVTEYNLETSVTIFDVPVNNHILLFTSKTSENFNPIYESYESAALEFRGQIIFVLVDTDESRNGRLFEYFRITEVDTPAIRILNITSDTKYRMLADDVTFENVRSFCQSYLDGKAKLQTNSEEIPSDWDKHPVKVLVGKNFNKVAFNKSNDAFVLFYAPWNKESQELLPVWEELGKRYMNNTNVTIAKIDCTANDIQLIVLDRYPYVRFFPAGSDNRSVRYTGDKTIMAFTEFLENELRSSNAKEEDSSETSSDDDAKKIKEEL